MGEHTEKLARVFNRQHFSSSQVIQERNKNENQSNTFDKNSDEVHDVSDMQH